MGRAIGFGNTRPIVLLFAAATALLIILAFKERIWLLIPICWSLTGSISALPLPLAVNELAVLMAGAGFVALIAMKQVRLQDKFNHLDVLLWINLLYLFSVYLRNPVGINAFGSELVGGRPYFSIMISVVACWILSRMRIKPELARIFPLILLGPSIFISLLGMATRVFPFLTPFVAPLYSGIDISSYVEEEFLGQQSAGFDINERFTSLAAFGGGAITVGVSYWNPRTMLNPLYIFRFLTLVVGLTLILMAGYRNAFAATAFVLLLASFFYERGIGFLRIVALGTIGLTLLIGVQGNFVRLPDSFQRAMSFLPGNWSPGTRENAQVSTEWRWKMWEIALTSDKYIHNKLLGDGFGFTQTDLEAMMYASLGMGDFGGPDAAIEPFLIQGSYHSGPVSAIRYVGVVGLVLYIVLMVAIARYSWKLVWRAWGTPYQPLAIFAGVAYVIFPIYYIFIFGGYNGDFPNSIYGIGLLKLIAHSLDDYRAQKIAPRVNNLPVANKSQGMVAGGDPRLRPA